MEEREDVFTVFCQGHGTSRHQAAKYAGPKGLWLKLPQGGHEHISIPSAPLLLHNLYAWDELEDVGYGWSWNPLHWLISLVQFLVLVVYYGVRGIRKSLPHNYWTRDSIGGEDDVRQYVSAVEIACVSRPEGKIVLFGCSRGASVVLASLSRLDKKLFSPTGPIKLAIVEAPFASVSSVLPKQKGAWFPPWLKEWAAETFARYNRQQWSPEMSVQCQDFPLQLPLAFITSNVDKIVPKEETLYLMELLRKKGHQQIRHCELEKSHHSEMPISSCKKDREKYHNFLSELYREIL
jgi:hypothetical protein